MSFEVVEWTIENFGCWNRKIHDNAITSPDFGIFGTLCSINLYPKGLSGRGELIAVQIRSTLNTLMFCVDLLFIGPDGSLLSTEQVFVKEGEEDVESELKFEDIVTLTRKKADLHKDQLTVKIKCSNGGVKSLHCMQSAICVHDTSVKISGEMFYKYPFLDHIITSISTLGWPVDDANFTSIDLTGLVDQSDVAKIELKLMPNGIKKRTSVYVRISVLNKDDVAIRSEEKDHIFYGDEEWTCFDSLTRDKLRKEEFSLLLRIKVIPGKIFVRNQLKYHTIQGNNVDIMPPSSLGHETPSKILEDSVNVLSKNFTTLYKDRKFSDLLINCDTVAFPVHKVILSARSPVFESMLSSDMAEALSGTVDIKDMDPSTLDLFLIYLYTGTVEELQYDRALKLYYAADKYQVPYLKRECASLLCADLSVSNVCDTLSLADKHQDFELTTGSHDFILNHYNEVLKSDEWKNFMSSQPQLALKTVTHFAEKDTVGKLNIC